MRSKSKLLQSIADDFLEKTSQNAPDISPEQAREKLKELDTQDLLVNVEKTIISDLALKNVQSNDLVFRQFSILTSPNGSKYLNYSLSFSKNILDQVNASVARNKQAHPNFILSNYVLNVIQRLNPGMPARGFVQMG